jgi:transposase
MHVDTSRRHYTAADGSVREYRRHLLRRSYRDERGRSQKETLANLSDLPDKAIDAVRTVLAGRTLVEADSAFAIERALPHGDVAAAHAMASRLGLKQLLGPDCRQRDLAYALIISRVVRPASKLSTLSWWEDTTLGVDLAVAGASTDEVYAAMDWLVGRQDRIETALAARHLTPAGTALFDLSSSWLEGRRCELAGFGYSRDGKRGKPQIEYGLLTDPVGRPVAIRVFAGNTADPEAFAAAVTTVRDTFGIDRLTLVGDRGSLTTTRISQLRTLHGMGWVTALRAPAIAALAADSGPLQMSLFDTQNFAEITHPDYPGERLVACRNPALADERARKREDLLQATEADLDKIAVSVHSGRLTGADRIGVKIGKIINRHKVGKHIILDITDTSLRWRRDQPRIDTEAALDGIYVLRTSLDPDTLDTPAVITTYKNLAHVERDFRNIKTDDLDLRPVFHYLADRVRAHVFLCMLATYITWHLRDTLAPLTYTDEHIPARADPVAPAQRSTHAKAKDASKQTPDGLTVRSYQNLLSHLRTLNRETITFAGQHIQKITTPTPTQRRVFELINTPIPLTLAQR